ncbi:hypothetical protein [Kitasatospora sp. NPDC059462]|uniref:hypothetical protein n=1 Tax=Kitasatospora sp. NPDC059462 TaxID=3346841 RepID=UPI00368F8C7B
MTLENWADLGTALASIATLLLVGFGGWQLKALAHQLRLGQQSTEAAVRAADAAQATVAESVRARIDALAPRLTVLPEQAPWPPFIDRGRSGMPLGSDRRMLDSMSLHSSEEARGEFVFPENEHMLMWFRLRAVVTNEGKSTTRVHLKGEGRFIEGQSPLIPGVTIPCPPVVGIPGETYLHREHVLRPGESALFEWAAGLPIGDWAAGHAAHGDTQPGSSTMFLTSMDASEFGVIDSVKIVLAGRPVEPVPQRNSHWRLSHPEGIRVTVYPTYRRYRHEAFPNEMQGTPTPSVLGLPAVGGLRKGAPSTCEGVGPHSPPPDDVNMPTSPWPCHGM